MQEGAAVSERGVLPVATPDSITMLLSRTSAGDQQAFTHLIPLIYKDLHRIAEGCVRSELPGHTLQATALIHEVYLRLVDYHGLDYRDRGHFFALAARIMRRILVDHARARRAVKRGSALKITLDENLKVSSEKERIVVLLDDALKQLAKQDATKARLVEMRFFAGMTAEDIAECVAMPVHTVRRELRIAQAWIRRELDT
jgi:RNA polymerase sigma factor (TIGR02999 family)